MTMCGLLSSRRRQAAASALDAYLFAAVARCQKYYGVSFALSARRDATRAHTRRKLRAHVITFFASAIAFLRARIRAQV